MINLQNSKKLLQTYDQIRIKRPIRSKDCSKEKIHDLSFYQSFYKTQRQQKSHQGQERNINKESNFIKIQFKAHQRMKQNEEIRMRRKILTTSQKLYHQKRVAYTNYIRQIYRKINEELSHVNNFMTIGTQPAKSARLSDENIRLKQKKKIYADTARNFSKHCCLKMESECESLTSNAINPLLPKFQSSQKIKNKKRQVQTINQQPQKIKYNLTNIAQFIPIKKISFKKQPFVFGMSQKQIAQGDKNKCSLYFDFLWKINYSNGLYVSASPQDTIYKAFIGVGNNSCMVKGILKRRFWWIITDKPEEANFVWTQLKINSFFKNQKNNQKTILSKTNNRLQPIKNNQQEADLHEKIFNREDLHNWQIHMQKNIKTQEIINEKTYARRIGLLYKKSLHKIQTSKSIEIQNHFQQNYQLGNKKALFYHLRRFYTLNKKNVFQIIPSTFHIIKGVEDQQFKRFLQEYDFLQRSKFSKNIWILKPGENSNRGKGITVCHCLDDIKYRLKSKQKNSDGSLRTFILQKYLQTPLLYHGRKFDLRHYMLVTCFNGDFKAYWYPEGYVRTASNMYCLKKNSQLVVHLTNDAVQKYSQGYGRYEKGNKISYDKLQTYLNKCGYTHNIFYSTILPRMKQIAYKAVQSTFCYLDEKKKQHNFELFGMDFMIDDQLKPWLIEINTNPCLQLSCPLLARLLPQLIENTLRICVDPFFPPPENWAQTKRVHVGQNPLAENKYQLFFDQSEDGAETIALYDGQAKFTNIGQLEEDDEIYENDGNQNWNQNEENK